MTFFGSAHSDFSKCDFPRGLTPPLRGSVHTVNAPSAPLVPQVALCDDYSLPVDFVNKRQTLRSWRPLSACEPCGPAIELLDTYCDPRDSKAYLVPGEDATAKVYTSPDREYTHPYADGTRAGARFCKAAKAAKVAARAAAEAAEAEVAVATSIGTTITTINPAATATTDEEVDGEDADDEDPEDGEDADDESCRPSAPPVEDDGAYEDVIVQELQEKYLLELQRQQQQQQQLREDQPAGRHLVGEVVGEAAVQAVQVLQAVQLPPRCPYYYADLLLPRAPPREHRKRGHDTRRYRKSASVDSATPVCPTAAEAGATPAEDCPCQGGRRCLPARGWSLIEDGSGGMSPVSGAPPRLPDPFDLGDDMNRRLHLYETAFDSRVAAPLDRRGEDVSNHAILAVSPAVSIGSQDGTPGAGGAGAAVLSSSLGGLHLGSSGGSERSDSPLRGYSPPPPGSAPSSAPLPAKFHGHGSQGRSMLSLRSAPSAPHLATKAVREIKGRPGHPRPTSLAMTASSSTASSTDAAAGTSSQQDLPLALARPSRARTILEFKGRPSSGRVDRPLSLVAPRRPKFSSTESMATSSSGGSLESVRSSTSEGERSSSSDGRPGSSSLSSHSEDSAGPMMLHGPNSGPTRLYNSAKLHILSPISDKSSLEPCSETSDNNRNNNSERASPEPVSGGAGDGTPTGSTGPLPGGNGGSAAGTPTGNTPSIGLTLNLNADQQTKNTRSRRTPNNRNLNLNALSLHGVQSVFGPNKNGDGEVPGSDSGISVDGSNLRWANNYHQDLEHLPFDMPKLRRRRANPVVDTTTSGSATSVEAGSAGSGGAGHEDLPFDMPKLRRKLRASLSLANSSGSSSASQSSEPQDVEQLLQDLPFDMPKLRKKQLSRSSESSSTSQSDPSAPSAGPGSSSGTAGRPALSLNLTGGLGPLGSPFGGCGSLGTGPAGPGAGVGAGPGPGAGVPAESFGSGASSAFASTRAFAPRGRPGLPVLSLSFGSNTINAPSAHIDTNLPLERQGWYLGAISRLEAERLLRQAGEGSYLVRNSESTRQDFSLSLKSARGFMHMRIQKDENGRFILGQFSRPFESVPEMIRHFSLNRLPIRGAEHMCLLHPVIQPLL
ncbi:SH2 domain-containing adapter protein F [Frankliniella fusca]|uniref:SH2 domain-containing adapter protein D n=1 Tax=Frankliniella fusca TaxID=407009 RepID=A0AAE1HIE5_9NEOP|nr:SH2 domain-containing adapter protein F [Frankliniella fusca]